MLGASCLTRGRMGHRMLGCSCLIGGMGRDRTRGVGEEEGEGEGGGWGEEGTEVIEVMVSGTIIILIFIDF